MPEFFGGLIAGIGVVLVILLTSLASNSDERRQDNWVEFCAEHGGTFYPHGVVTEHVIYYDDVCLVP